MPDPLNLPPEPALSEPETDLEKSATGSKKPERSGQLRSADGEELGQTPVEVKLLPGALKVIVPQ